jgi:hypothetical protein
MTPFSIQRRAEQKGHFLQVQMDKRYIHDTPTTYLVMCTLMSQFRLSHDAGEVAAPALAAALTVSFS